MKESKQRGGVPGAPQLAKYRFKKGETGNRRGRPTDARVDEEFRSISLSAAIKRYLVKHPKKVDQLAKLVIEASLGNVPAEQARILQMVRAIDVVKAMLDRTEGPVVQKVDQTLRTDKTVIVHQGPAINLDELESDGNSSRAN